VPEHARNVNQKKIIPMMSLDSCFSAINKATIDVKAKQQIKLSVRHSYFRQTQTETTPFN